jgi:hypothetical protein
VLTALADDVRALHSHSPLAKEVTIVAGYLSWPY